MSLLIDDDDDDDGGKGNSGTAVKQEDGSTTVVATPSKAVLVPDLASITDEDIESLPLSDLAASIEYSPEGEVTRPRLAWWGEQQDRELMIGVYLHGYGKFSTIQQDPRFSFRAILLRLATKHGKPAAADDANANGDAGANASGNGAAASGEAAAGDTAKAPTVSVKTEPTAVKTEPKADDAAGTEPKAEGKAAEGKAADGKAADGKAAKAAPDTSWANLTVDVNEPLDLDEDEENEVLAQIPELNLWPDATMLNKHIKRMVLPPQRKKKAPTAPQPSAEERRAAREAEKAAKEAAAKALATLPPVPYSRKPQPDWCYTEKSAFCNFLTNMGVPTFNAPLHIPPNGETLLRPWELTWEHVVRLCRLQKTPAMAKKYFDNEFLPHCRFVAVADAPETKQPGPRGIRIVDPEQPLTR